MDITIVKFPIRHFNELVDIISWLNDNVGKMQSENTKISDVFYSRQVTDTRGDGWAYTRIWDNGPIELYELWCSKELITEFILTWA